PTLIAALSLRDPLPIFGRYVRIGALDIAHHHAAGGLVQQHLLATRRVDKTGIGTFRADRQRVAGGRSVRTLHNRERAAEVDRLRSEEHTLNSSHSQISY